MWLLQTGTVLAETDDNFVFCVPRDLTSYLNPPGPFPDVAFFVRDSGLGATEFHMMSGRATYQQYLLQMAMPWAPSDAATYDLLWDGDVTRAFRVNKVTGVVERADPRTGTATGKASIPFGRGVLQPNFRFLLTQNGLMAIDPKGPSGNTEVYVTNYVSTGSGYGYSVPVRYTTLWGPSDDTLDFVDPGGGGLALYNRGTTASGFTEYASVDSSFQRYQGSLPDRVTELNAPVGTNHQVMLHRGKMVVVIKNGTGTQTTEVHIANNPP
ncbi:MAG: hypothetical protein QM784_17495 [Polyangiaceae bacterium]